MSKVITDEKKIDRFLTRGVENVYPSKSDVKKRMMEGKQLKMYLGIDPTGPTLHLGHAIPLIKMREFQELGHKVIMLIGDFTGMIGDPTDKSAARKKLTKEQVKENYKIYKKQAEKIIDINKADVKYNNDWLGKLKFDEVVEIASNFTVQRMLERDMFEKRIKEGKPVYLHEFLYPLMQGYDSIAMDVDGEIGGNDQTFNMLAGRDLMKSMVGKDKFVIAGKLLVDPSGDKMGKTTGNMITLQDSPENKFGKIMSQPDSLIEDSFEILTDRDMDEIKRRLSSDENPRDIKIELAYDVVKRFDSEEEAVKAKENFINVFSKKNKPDEIPTHKVSQSKIKIIDLMVETKTASSKSEARRLIEQKGVKINDEVVSDTNQELEVKEGIILQVGKRRFMKLGL